MMYCNILVDLTIYNVNYATIDLETAYYSSLCEHIVMNFEKEKEAKMSSRCHSHRQIIAKLACTANKHKLSEILIQIYNCRHYHTAPSFCAVL